MRIFVGRTVVAAALVAASAICAAQDASTIPPIPAPAAVTLDAKSSALLVLDVSTAICQPNPACAATLPAIGSLLEKARAAGVPVIYSTTPSPKGPNPLIAAVAPKPGDPVVVARANKFIDTNLAELLKQRGAETLVIVGTSANGAVLYTGYHANLLGFTLVVAEDGISSASPIGTTVARYQLLNEPGFTNAANKPLAPKMVTLSRTDLITWR